jgi:outer membrane receptor protein involved in Fe transport
LLAFAALGAPLTAQEPETGDEGAEAIVVTGRALPDTPGSPAYGTITLEREALLATGSGRLEDALGTVAGFQQFRRSDSRSANPTAQGVTLRALGGNAASRALVLLDGVPMVDPFFGQVPLSALAPERLASARVTRGGGSGPFGAGALAGTIELASAPAGDFGPLSGSALVNDRAETELSATLAPSLGAGFATLSGRWDRGGGFWTTPESQRVAASVPARHESWSMQLRGVAPLGEAVELQARLLAFRDRRVLRFAGAENATEGEDASLRLIGQGRWRFDALAYVQRRDFSNVVVSSTRFVPALDQRETPATGLGGKFELRPPVGGGHVPRLGADYRKALGTLQEDAISTVTGRVTERRLAGGANTDLGLFAEDDWTLGALTLTAGARADRTTIREGFTEARSPAGVAIARADFPDRADWSASFRGGALLRLDGGLALRAAAYSGLRLPTLNELYRAFVIFPVTTRANAALRNERLEGYEIGADWRAGEALSLAVTAFDNRVRDAIANVTIGPNLRQRRNIAAIEVRGIEAAAQARLGALRFTGSLAWTDAVMRGGAEAAALEGRRPAQTPRWSASGTVSWRPRSDWLFSLTARHVGAQFEDDLGTALLPAVTTLDGYAEAPLGRRAALVLRAENLTDAEIVTQNQGGAIDLGAPRTVWAGLKFGL